ncbi:MAG: hypothetical protein ACKVZH_12785 [Blastocatellia bacterium]
MKFLKTNTRKLIAVALITLTAFSAIVANSLVKERDASTNIEIQLCQKGENGQWNIIDKAKGSANFVASVADLASGKELTSPVNWNITSEKGRRISVKMLRAAKVNLNPTTGLMELEVPLDVTVNGNIKTSFTSKLTTQSLSTPVGQLVGKRADINVNAKTLSAGLVGFNSVKQRDFIQGLLAPGAKLAEQAPARGKKETAIRTPGAVGGMIADEIIIVIKGDGIARAK